jgi:hypothetical protein
MSFKSLGEAAEAVVNKLNPLAGYLCKSCGITVFGFKRDQLCTACRCALEGYRQPTPQDRTNDSREHGWRAAECPPDEGQYEAVARRRDAREGFDD